MNNLARLLASLPCLAFLQSCGHTLVYDKDTLLSSRASVALPLGAVHTPTRETNQIQVQGAAAFAGQWPSRISASATPGWSLDWLDSTEVGSRSRVSLPAVQGHGSLALVFQGKLRLGTGVDLSENGLAGWSDLGYRWGGEWGTEGFVDFGVLPVRSNARWNSLRVWKKDISPDSSRQLDTTLSESSHRYFWRTGLHFARRSGGPWIEGQWTRITLFTAPATGDDLVGNVLTLGAGWTHPTRFGSLVAFGRASVVGSTFVPPQLGVQWTGEMGF